MILWTLSQSTDGNAEDDDDREGLMDPSNDDGGVLNTRQNRRDANRRDEKLARGSRDMG